MADERKWSRERKLSSLEPGFANRIIRVIDRLESVGFKAKIVYAWRSRETQKELYDKKRSKTLNSPHVGLGEEGTGFAVDLVDAAHWWGGGEDQDESRAMLFFGALGLAAKEEGLVWGGDWGWDFAHVELGGWRDAG